MSKSAENSRQKPRVRRVQRVYFFWQDWFATVQLVLQALWQEAWHSPQPPVWALWLRQGFWMVWMCFILFHLVHQIAARAAVVSIIHDAARARKGYS